MNRMRKVFCFLMATMFAAFALPAAADKIFSISMNPSSISPPQTIQHLFVTWTNPSTNGANSVINSVKLDVPAGVTFTINGWQTVNTTGTTVGGGTSNPAIGVTQTGAALIAISNITGAKPGGTFVLDLTVTVPNKLDCSKVSKGYAWSGTTWGGTQFGPSSPSADVELDFTCTLGCDTGNNTGGHYGSAVLTQSGFEGQADWGLVRGPNWNSENCTLVPYQFNLNSTTKTASFIAGNKGTQDISAEYVVVFNPIPYPGYTVPPGSTVGFWPNYRPNLAWSNTFYGGNGVFAVSGTTTPKLPLPSLDYVPALACLDDNVAGPNVLPTIPDDSATSGPFSTAYAAGNTQYQPGKLALICVANMGWTSLTLPFPNSFGLPAGAYLQPWYKIIDRADGWVGLP
jgi:hypothetical protein